jgi:hypothetical protein
MALSSWLVCTAVYRMVSRSETAYTLLAAFQKLPSERLPRSPISLITQGMICGMPSVSRTWLAAKRGRRIW